MLTSNDNYNIPNTSYVNKDFQTVYPELLNLIKELTYRWDPTITDESDPLIVLVKLNALLADKCNYNIDKNVLETSPLTVTQIENARPLFEQLGYNMRWYQAASSEISLKWNGDIVKEDTEEAEKNYKNVYTLPRFTTFTDVDNQYIYSSVSEIPIVVDGSIATGQILQGTPVKLEINNSYNISFINLDEENRIFFPDQNVAENGIFINTIDASDFESWKKVDNLQVQNLGQKVYKFGVDRKQRYCYIQFPEDIASIMGAGINITYIKTDGFEGNIGANTLQRLTSDVTVSGEDENGNPVDSYVFTELNLYVQNLVASWGGKDPESIADAYRQYKKIAGTFNTLVSLRDYINYFIRTDSVSNCFVCDRMNDIQTAYKIMTYDNGIYKKITDWEIIPGTTEEDKLDPFDLKLYALRWQDKIDDTSQYASSFQILPYYSRDTENYPECSQEEILVNSDYGVLSQDDNEEDSFGVVKYACHDFVPYEANKILLLKNKYPLDIKIVPQYKLTDVQTREVKNNIIQELIKALNSKKINFGETPEYDFIYQTIQGADPRIKATVLDTLKYYTYASYYESYLDGNKTKYKLKEICISDETNYTEGYYINEKFYSQNMPQQKYLLKPDIGSYCMDISTENIYLTKKSETSDRQYELYSNRRKNIRCDIYAKSILNGNTPIYKNSEFFYQPGQKEIILDYTIKSIQPYTSVVIAEKDTDIQWGTVDVRQNLIITGNYLPGSFYAEKWGDSSHSFKYIWFDDGNYSISSAITDPQVTNQIYASVKKIKKYTNGKYEVYPSSPSIFIQYKNDGSQKTLINDSELYEAKYLYKTYSPQEYINNDIKTNDSVTFYKPNLIEDTKYSSYVKVIRFYDNMDDDGGPRDQSKYKSIPKNSDYTIKDGEYFSFLWRLEGDDTYKYRTYGEGKIINCSFEFPATQQILQNTTIPKDVTGFIDYLKRGNSDYDRQLPLVDVSYSYKGNSQTDTLTSYISKALATSDYAMQSGREVQIKKPNSVVVSDVGDRFYWVLNTKKKFNDSSEKWEYVLFEEGQTDYILKSDEYFMYYNKQMTALYSVGYGTIIHRENTQQDGTLPMWSVEAISYDSIMDSSLSNNDIMFQNTGSIKVTVTENSITEAGEGANLGVSLSQDVFVEGTSNAVRYAIFTKNSGIIVRQNKYQDSFITNLLDTNIYVDNEKITWFYPDGSEYSNSSVGAFSQLSLMLNNDMITVLTQNQNIIVETTENDEFPISGNIEPYSTTLSDSQRFYTSTNYQPTCVLSSPSIYTRGASYYPTVYQGINGEEEYTKMYFYKNTLFNVDSDTVSSSLYISGVSEIQIKLDDSYVSPKTISINTSLPSIDGNKYVFKFYVHGLPQSVQEQSEPNITSFLRFGPNVYEANKLSESSHSTDPEDNKKIYKNDQYSFVYDNSISQGLPIVLDIYNIHNAVLTVQFSKLYPVQKPDFIESEDIFNDILSRVSELDRENKFDYIYEIPDNEYIENPLDGASFLNNSHPYNKYTIPQIYSISTVVTNKIM